MKKITLSIPEPCDKKWAELTETGQFGCRFCDRCEKQIRDFTHSTDAEIAQFFKKKEANVCGKFRPDQLGRPIRLQPRPAIFGKAAGLVFGGLLAATTQESCFMGKVVDPKENTAMPSVQNEAAPVKNAIIGDTILPEKPKTPSQKVKPKSTEPCHSKDEIMGKVNPDYIKKHPKSE